MFQRPDRIHSGGLAVVIQHHRGAQQPHDTQRQQEHRRIETHPMRELLQVEKDPGNEHNAYGQTHSQGQDLDENI